MMDINKIIIMGRLGADPVVRQTKSGVAVVHFPVATSRRLRPATDTSPAEEIAETEDESSETEGSGSASNVVALEQTQWHRVVAWGKQGETCARLLKKGEAVYIEGSLRSHKYTSQDGSARVAYEVHAEQVSFLGRRSFSMAPRALEAAAH